MVTRNVPQLEDAPSATARVSRWPSRPWTPPRPCAAASIPSTPAPGSPWKPPTASSTPPADDLVVVRALDAANNFGLAKVVVRQIQNPNTIALTMLLSSITLKNILSFKDTTLELGPLNVLIGPNASGKSNLIEAISLLQAAPTNLSVPILLGGGVGAWIWKGGPAGSPIAALECSVTWGPSFLYTLEFSEDARGLLIWRERFEDAAQAPQQTGAGVHFDRTTAGVAFSGTGPEAKLGEISAFESVLARFKNPLDPTPITSLGRHFEGIRIYREFSTGPSAQTRQGVAPVVPKGFLQDGGHNLAVVLDEMRFNQTIRRVNEYLPRFCGEFEEVLVRLHAGIAHTYVREKGLVEPVPAIRLSDGTLKFLCLLTVLLHPQLPPVLCIEEPEVGLHPDALQLVAEALVEASTRSQLILTTHSADLVDALSDRPEAVVVCERDFDNSTQFKRLQRADLDVWLQRYRLGELWRKGEIGGNRW